MLEAIRSPQPAIKYEIEVREQGFVEFQVPFARGVRIIVFVIRQEEDEERFTDLVAAAESSLAFWDNPLDDEEWNNA